MRSKAEVACNTCGNHWTPFLTNLIDHREGCPYCGGSLYQDDNVLTARINKVQQGRAEVISIIHNYKGSNSRGINMHCLLCGHTWSAWANNLKRGMGCPMCGKFSIGEILVENILSFNHIKFTAQYYVNIDGSVNIFDFLLTTNNNVYAIEYDGIQHFDKNNIWHHNKDNEKNLWCIKNDIELIRIPYTISSVSDIASYISYYINIKLEVPAKLRMPARYMIDKITEYHKYHGVKETAIKFDVSTNKVKRSFKLVMGCSKKEYKLSLPFKLEVANYFLTHNQKETIARFHIGERRMRDIFKEIYQESKANYIKKNKAIIFRPSSYYKS